MTESKRNPNEDALGAGLDSDAPEIPDVVKGEGVDESSEAVSSSGDSIFATDGAESHANN